MDRRQKHHECGRVTASEDTWAHCCVCDGRIHHEGCTSRRVVSKDCCPARHKMLFEQGNTRGLGDSSFIMWTPAHPYGIHSSEIRKGTANGND